MTEEENLTVRELLTQTYDLLVERHEPQIITFEGRKPRAQIATDGDINHPRSVYMSYETAGVFDFGGGSQWIMGNGQRWGHENYLPFHDSDLLAIEIDKEENLTEKDIREHIRTSTRLRNSLLVGHYGAGKLNEEAIKTSKRGTQLTRELGRKGQAFHPGRRILYKPEFVEEVAGEIEKLLTNWEPRFTNTTAYTY